MSKSKDVKLFGPVFWLHLPMVLAANLSPLLFPWQFILICVIFLYVQFAIFKGCVLKQAQFGKDPDMTFYTLYLEKLGFKFSRKEFAIYMRCVHPVVLLIIAISIQTILKVPPALEINKF